MFAWVFHNTGYSVLIFLSHFIIVLQIAVEERGLFNRASSTLFLGLLCFEEVAFISNILGDFKAILYVVTCFHLQK